MLLELAVGRMNCLDGMNGEGPIGRGIRGSSKRQAPRSIEWGQGSQVGFARQGCIGDDHRSFTLRSQGGQKVSQASHHPSVVDR